jgi:hypothetical protein
MPPLPLGCVAAMWPPTCEAALQWLKRRGRHRLALDPSNVYARETCEQPTASLGLTPNERGNCGAMSPQKCPFFGVS